MAPPALTPSGPPPAAAREATPPLTPEEQARVEFYRAQFRAMGITDEDIERLNEPTDVPLEAELAYLDGRGPDPCPR